MTGGGGGGPVARGLLYALAAFGFGFVLAPVREFALAPAIGLLAATLVELPVMLAFCWWLAGRLARALGPSLAPRAVMGGAALGLLLLAEFGVGVFVRGWDFAGWLRHFAAPEGAATGAAYLVFAALPALRRASARR